MVAAVAENADLLVEGRLRWQEPIDANPGLFSGIW